MRNFEAEAHIALTIVALIVVIPLAIWGLSGDSVVSGTVEKTWTESYNYYVRYEASVNNNGTVIVAAMDQNAFAAMQIGNSCTFHYNNFGYLTSYKCKG